MGFNDTPNLERAKTTIDIERDRLLTHVVILQRTIIDGCRTGEFFRAYEKLEEIKVKIDELQKMHLKNKTP